MVAIRLIWASLRQQKSLYLLWVLSLSTAVTGLVIIDVYRRSLASTLELQGRKILTADLAVSARRALTQNENQRLREILPAGSTFARLTELFAMVSGGNESRLAMLRFIDNDFPLVGELQIESANRELNTTARGLNLQPSRQVWVAADLLTLMNLSIGQTLRVGQANFVITGIIRKDSSQTFRMGNMAPRIYLHRQHLGETGLIQFGSTFSETHYALIKKPEPSLKKRLEEAFPEAGVNVTLPADLEQGSLRVLSGIMDYLGLIGLVTLSLGWLGVYYLGRRWLKLELHVTGILKALGVSSQQALLILLLKLMLILLIGIILGGWLSWLGARAVLPKFSASLPADFQLVWSWQNTLLLLTVGPLSGLLLLLSPIMATAWEKPLFLLSGSAKLARPMASATLLLILTGILFFAITWLQARSWRVTAAFLGTMAVTLFIISGTASLSLYAVKRWRAQLRSWPLHLVSAQWTRRWTTSLLLVTVSALAGLLAQLIPHLERSLVGELNTPDKLTRPSLFLFDIQDEQLEPLRKFMDQNGLSISQFSPFIRARILSVNDKTFERGQVDSWSTREEELEARFRNRGVNLSFRQKLSSSESIIRGESWEKHSSEPAQISVEERYAKRVGLDLGDRLRFDVQGVEIEATIASLRSINWNSFEPNFFIQFPEGVLEAAPKTWILTVKPSQQLTPPQIQTIITKKFPNVTSINVQEALTNVTDLVVKLSAGLKIASRLSLALGVFVFFMILIFQLISSKRDWMQLRLQGLNTRDIWKLQLLTYGGLGVLGSLLGAILSALVAWGIAKFGFNSRVQFDWIGSSAILISLWTLLFAGISWLGLRQLRGSYKLPDEGVGG